jgi:amino acid adenylation domain-containing protein/FkbM family methyltransferase
MTRGNGENMMNNPMNSTTEDSRIGLRNYWLRKLKDSAELSAIQHDCPVHRERKYVEMNVQLDEGTCSGLIGLSGNRDFLVYTVWVAALSVCLSRYTGNRKIIVGSPMLKDENSNANSRNAVVLLNEVDPAVKFREFILGVRRDLVDAYERQDYPFEKLIHDLGADDKTRCRIFSVMLAMRGVHMEVPEVNNDITMIIDHNDKGISIAIKYDSNMYGKKTVGRFADHCINMLKNGIENTESVISRLDMLLPEEKQEALSVSNGGTETAYEPNMYVHRMFEDQVSRTPDDKAVIFKDDFLSYGELNDRANRLAHYLISIGMGPGKFAVICIEPCLEMIVGLFAILKSGGAYVPVDSSYPHERILSMTAETSPHVVLTKQKYSGFFSNGNFRIVTVEQFGDDRGSQENGNPSASGLSADDHAYVIFTSGSTGKPKGAVVNHGGWTNLINWFVGEFGINKSDRVLLVSSFSFDLTQKNIFAPLLVGGQLHLMESGYYDPENISELIGEKRITILNCTPSAFYPLIECKAESGFGRLSSLRCLILGGEPISSSRLGKWFKSDECRADVANTYGPTECTDICSCFRIRHDDRLPEVIPIGKPINNTRIYVLNKADEPVPCGINGELCIGGAGVGAGYINDERLTAEKFIKDPVREDGSGLIYKTGDIVRRLDDGNILYVGRVDNQVKIRGFRIETAEIENIARMHPGIQDSAVMARKDQDGSFKLVSYIVPDPEKAAVVKKVSRMLKDGPDKKIYNLPNGMMIRHLNKSESDFVYKEIFEDKIYTDNGIRLKEGSTVLDVGANIGLFPLFLAGTCKNTVIFSFEPIPPIFEVLSDNCSLYGLNARLFKYGLSDRRKTEEITYYPHVSIMSGAYADNVEDHDNIKSFIMKERELNGSGDELSEKEIDDLVDARLKNEKYVCEFKTVSDAIDENKIEEIDLLKIDVEKSEMDILSGINEGDWKKIKQIILEIHDVDGRLKKIEALLKSKDYEIFYEKEEKLQDNEIYNLYAISRGFASVRSEENGDVRNNMLEESWYSPNVLVDDLKSFLRGKLPEYMIPTDFFVIDEMPLTPNGKVDRESLMLIDDSRYNLNDNYMKPENALQEQVAGIWTEVFNMDRIGIDDDFIQLGGHSLLATAIISRLRKLFKIDIPVFSFYENPTIKALSKIIDDLLNS